MRKRWAALLAVATMVLALGATTGTALATTSDSCFDPATFGSRPAACQAQTVESHVSVAVASVGRHSFGWYSLVCARGDDVVQRSGRIGVGGRKTITDDRIGLYRPTCFLEVTAVADSPFHNARGSVSLFS